MGILSILDVVNKARKSIISLTILTSMLAASIVSSQDLGQLPFCGNVVERTISRRLLYVTTLDGKLTALDITNNGKVHWSVPTGPGPLISSSIHRLELTNNGQLVRMIPSLSGGIYKFDGETIDPIPISVENLLSASYKFSEDLVISGGKETKSYGVSARTGQILYECSMHGCVNNTNTGSLRSNGDDETLHTTNDSEFVPDHDTLLDDVIVIRRQTQTVRAVESRTGTERWNFSVGQHELDLIKSAECHDKPLSPLDMAILDTDIKIVVPDGIVCAFSKTDSSRMLWKYKFDHPIVSVWKNGPSDMLESIDLFSASRWIWNAETNNFTPPTNISPSIYLGMHNKQIYIQESRNLRNEIVDKTNSFNYHLVSSDSTMPQIPWKPIIGKNTALIPFYTDNTETTPTIIEGNELVSYENENKVAAISVLYATEYVNGNGFYLYSKDDLNKTENARCETNHVINKTSANKTDDFNLNFEHTVVDTPVRIVILSLWFWWKEILVITLTSAIILNWFFAPRIRREREIVVIERHIPVPTGIEATEETVSAGTNRSLSESNSQNSENFSSRFQGDFDLVQCLGKGGFGVVFEAKNKLDDCKYAIKRITLPNKKESRERVMREVKTLANCEHQNIVRYFQAWVETPPPGWQEDEDSKWLARDMSTSIEIETPDGTTLPQFSNSHKSIRDKNKSLESWISNVTNGNDFNGSYRKSFSEIDDTDDDFAIEFRSDSQSCIISNGQGGSIAIDVDKRIEDLDCSRLSDSFKIEFVNSADGVNENEMISLTSNISSNRKKTHKRPNSLDLSSMGDGKALIPLKNINCQSHLLHPPRVQNKVYLYIQMQLCRKQSLRDWLRDHKIEMRQPHIKNIFEQIVDAVDYVHLKGLIHRDLKPSNIFFSLGGQIKIGDFGLVTDMAEMPNMINEIAGGGDNNRNGINLKPRHTQQVGTHLYMSPEQLQGKHYDFKVDIFSLGLIFFELLVYFGTEMERIVTLKGLREGSFPTEFQIDFNDEFELLKLMLSIQPHERPPTTVLKQKLISLSSWVTLVDAPNAIDANGNNNSQINSLKNSLRTISETSSFCNDCNDDIFNTD